MEAMLISLLVFFAAPLHTSAAMNVSETEGRITPHCYIEGTNASCCATVGRYVFTPRKVCVTLEVSLKEMKTALYLTVDDEKYATGETEANELCVPILVTLRGCLKTYWIDGSLKEKRLEVCNKVSLRGIILQASQDLNCIGFKNGKFYFSDKPNGQNT